MSEEYIPKSKRDKKVAKVAEEEVAEEELKLTDIITLAWAPAKQELAMWQQKDEGADKPTYLWKDVPAVLTFDPINVKFHCDSERIIIFFSAPVLIERMRIGKDARVI